MAEPLMSLIDTAFVSRCGVLSLAALGPNTALFNVIFFIGFMALAVGARSRSLGHDSIIDRIIDTNIINISLH